MLRLHACKLCKPKSSWAGQAAQGVSSESESSCSLPACMLLSTDISIRHWADGLMLAWEAASRAKHWYRLAGVTGHVNA